MSEKIFNEHLEYLDELIRKAYELINPEENSLAYLQYKDLRDRLYGEKPACFLKLKKIGRDTSDYLLPICNRAGHVDPKVVQVSMKVVQKLMTDDKGTFDNNELQNILNKLQHRYNVYSKDVPKPPGLAAKKANITRMFKNVNSHLHGGDIEKTGSI
jgi:hypothetical protein